MKKTIVIFSIAFVLYSCAKRITPTTAAKATPTASSEVKVNNNTATIEAPPTIAAATEIKQPAPATAGEIKPMPEANKPKETTQVAKGKETFTTKCGRCHELKPAETYTAAKWVKIIDWMAPRAQLDATEKENVLAYVSFYSKA